MENSTPIFNISALRTPPQEYQNYIQFSNNFHLVTGPFLLSMNIVGFLSSVLTLATITRNKEFSEPCFICYQAIAISEMFFLFFDSPSYIYDMNPEKYRRNPYWYWMRDVGSTYMVLPFSEYTMLLTVFLSLQRTVALLLADFIPSH